MTKSGRKAICSPSPSPPPPLALGKEEREMGQHLFDDDTEAGLIS